MTSDPVMGKVYAITHSRKGRFTARVLDTSDPTWVDVEIVAGHAHHMAESNQDRGYAGDRLTLRREFVNSWKEVSDGK